MAQSEAAHVVRRLVDQHQRAILAIEFQPMAGAEIGGAAHREAAGGARPKREAERGIGLHRRLVGQAGQPRRQSGDRAAEPFEIIETEWLTKLPSAPPPSSPSVFQFLSRIRVRVVLDVPGDRDMAQAGRSRPRSSSALALRQASDLGKVEIDHGRPTAGRPPRHRVGAGQIGRHRLFGEHRLAEFERADGDLGLQARRCRDGDGIDVRMLDELCPVAERQRDIRGSRASSAVRAASVPASATTSQRGSRRNAGRWTRRP